MSASPRRTWTEEEVRSLGMTTDIPTASSVLGMSRGVGYQLAGEGRFPVRLLQNGNTRRVPVMELLRALGLEPPLNAPAPQDHVSGLRAV